MSVVEDANRATIGCLFPGLFNALLDVSIINWTNPDIFCVITDVLGFLNIGDADGQIDRQYVASIVQSTQHLFGLSNFRIIRKLVRLYVRSCDPNAERVVIWYLPKILEMFRESHVLAEIFGENPTFLCKILMMSEEVYTSLTRPFLERRSNRQLFFEMFNRTNIEDVLELVEMRPDFLEFCLGTFENCVLFQSVKGHGLRAIRQLMQVDRYTNVIINSQFFTYLHAKGYLETHDHVGIMKSLIDFFHQTHSEMTLEQLFMLFEIDVFMYKLLEKCTLESIELTENVVLALANTNLRIHGVKVFEFFEKCKGKGKVRLANIAERFTSLSKPKCSTPKANEPFREMMISALKQIQ